MSDPTNENTGAIPPEGTPAGGATEGQTEAMQATPDSAQTAELRSAYPGAPDAQSPTAGMQSAPWYRRRWAVITGTVAAAAILFLGGMAVGEAVWGYDGPDGLRGGGPGMFRQDGGQGFGRGDWGDSGQGGQGMVPHGLGQGRQGMGQGHGWDRDGDGWDHQRRGWDDDGEGRPDTPSVTPSPSISPQSLYQ